MNLCLINELDQERAKESFFTCCGSHRWAQMMTQARPFHSKEDVGLWAEQSWLQLKREDWMEAFDAHPKIGDIESLKKKYAVEKELSLGEQAGVNSATATVLTDLADYNKRYHEKFGYIFIVCATGKSADEMLTILKGRIDNVDEDELKNAIEEQKKITRIRLEKLGD